MTNLIYRKAVPEDAAMCIAIRGRTRENAFSAEALQALGITVESWAEGIRDGSFPGYVAVAAGQMTGYCFGERDSGEIIVLAMLPSHEGAGTGKALLQLVVDDFRKRGFTSLFLGCSSDPQARSYGFYRHLGWTSTGALDAGGDEILELTLV